MNKPRICVDFDGTIWDGQQVFADCIDTLTRLRETHRIAIFSARPTDAEREQMRAILDSNAVPYDEILPPKPAADYYIDDCGRQFISWKEIDQILSR